MILLKCDVCGKEYRYPATSVRAYVLMDSAHSVLPAGKECTGTLRSGTPMPSAEIAWK